MKTTLAAGVRSSSVDFDNDDHIEAKMHKLALGTYEDLSSSDESDNVLA